MQISMRVQTCDAAKSQVSGPCQTLQASRCRSQTSALCRSSTRIPQAPARKLTRCSRPQTLSRRSRQCQVQCSSVDAGATVDLRCTSAESC